MNALLLVLFALAGSAEETPADHLTPELLWQLGRVGAPQVSPDGRFLCLEITRYDIAENKGNADLWLLDTASDELRQLTTHEKSDRAPRWSPDGKRIGFLAARDGDTQVWAIPPGGGEATRITQVKGGVDNFSWSPDGTRIAYTTKVRIDKELKDLHPDLPKADARIIDDLLYRHWNEWYDGTYSHLMVALADGSAALDLMQDERVHTPLVPFGGAEQFAWSPDGQELCYTAKKVEHAESSTDSDLYVVPVAGGAARCITDGMDGFDRVPLYSPDGRFIAFHSMQRPTFEADRERLMLHDRTSGQTRELVADFPHWVGDMCWTPDGQALCFCSVVKGRTQLFLAGLDGTVKQLTDARHDLHGPAISPDGRVIYAQRSTMERPNEIVRLPIGGGAPMAITDINGGLFSHLKLPLIEDRWLATPDGKKLHCVVIKPADFDPKLKYPLITYCQGGPQSPITQSFSYRWNFHLMAANGYVIVAPSRRGMPGFGQEWNDAISKDWGGLAMQDYLTATDAMFAEPYIDRHHAAAVGASFGGYSVYWLMGHDQDDRFCAMIAHCGLFNLESFYGATEETWFANWDIAGMPYWAARDAQDAFDRNSPHRFVTNWNTPLLVIHGEKDFRVPVTEGMQAFTAARQRGIPARFLYFPEEGHWVTGVQNGILWHRVFFDWLDRFCKPANR